MMAFYLVLEMAKILMIAHDGLSTVFDQVAQEPQTESWVTVLFDHVQLWVVRSPAHLSGLGHNQVHTLVEIRLQRRQRRLKMKEKVRKQR
jgi:hypothetical protein